MDPREVCLLTMRRVAAVAGKVLAELWPEGPDGAVRETVDLMYIEVVAERGGVTVRRQAEVRDGWIWDAIETGRSAALRPPPWRQAESPAQ